MLCQKALSQQEPKQLQLQTSNCHYWSHFNAATNTCDCGSTLFDIVRCRTKEGANTDVNVSVIFGYCITLTNDESKAVVGACRHAVSCPHDCHYRPVSRNLSRDFCKEYGRTGQLCGKCGNACGSSPPAYSYYSQCFECSPGTNNWLKYLAISLLPTALFWLVIVMFRFRATSPQLTGYIFTCQVMTLPIVLRSILVSPEFNKRNYNVVGDLYLSLLSVWNLDFFRVFYAPFCLHPNASMLQLLSLDYIIAVCPLLLIIITYTLARFHYNNYKVVVWLCRPFIVCFARCRRQWDIQNSLVDAFATFLLLSYVKFFSVSIDLLTPTLVWDQKASIHQVALYYDGSTQYFGAAHLPYAIMAILALFLFIFLPTLLLCLYPCLCFQRLLNRWHCNGQVLHYFMDSFQGSFKDGTNGTRDCRYFAAIYLIARIVIHVGFIITNNTFSTFIQTSLLLLMILLLCCFQPYKKQIYTKVDTFFLIGLCLMINTSWQFRGKTVHALSTKINRLGVIPMCVPIIYPLCLVVVYVKRRCYSLRNVKDQLKVCCSGRATKSDDTFHF